MAGGVTFYGRWADNTRIPGKTYTPFHCFFLNVSSLMPTLIMRYDNIHDNPYGLFDLFDWESIHGRECRQAHLPEPEMPDRPVGT